MKNCYTSCDNRKIDMGLCECAEHHSKGFTEEMVASLNVAKKLLKSLGKEKVTQIMKGHLTENTISYNPLRDCIPTINEKTIKEMEDVLIEIHRVTHYSEKSLKLKLGANWEIFIPKTAYKGVKEGNLHYVSAWVAEKYKIEVL